MFGVTASVTAVFIIACALVFPAPHAFGVGPSGLSYFVTAQVGSDPCQNPSVGKLTIPIAITSATTTNLVSAIAGNYVTVCKWQMTVVGTSPTIEFEYGTTVSTACDTGATALTGPMAIPTTTIFVSPSATDTTLRTPVSQELCMLTGGTITGVEGYMSYVSQPY